MAKCKKCGKRGLFLKLNSDGICKNCETLAQAVIEASSDEKKFVKYGKSHLSVSDNSIISSEPSEADIGDKNIEQKPIATTDTNSPIRYIVDHYYYTKVVGVTFNGIQSILPQLHEGMPVQFIREPNNPFDRNAIGIWCSGKKIGHLSADEAKSIAPQMDRGIPYDGEISQITGGKGKTYGCEISVNVYKPSISGLTSQVEHIDESNPMFKKTCVLFGYDNFAAYNIAQSIANLGGFTRQRISGKTDFAIVNRGQPEYELKYSLAKIESYRAEGKKFEIMYSDKLEEIKRAYLNS
ncbi:MAG: HIRAN domain-containing protein [Eubacterium sp.]|nr:HIRAN domain-containing protein [Eubacterium sp.]